MNLTDFLPAGTSPETAILISVAIAALVNVIVFYNVLLVRDPLGPRLKAMQERREALKAGLIGPVRRRERQVKGLGVMRQIVNRLKLMRWQRTQSAPQRLAMAGWRSKDALVVFLFVKFAVPVLFAGIATFVLYGLGLYELPTVAKLSAIAVFAGIGFYLPDILVKNQATKRQHAIRKAMPDALDLMVICAEAGLSVDATFTRVAREMAHAAPVLSDEFGLTAIELGFLPDRTKALHNLNNRTNMPEVRGIVNTLIQTEKYGTPLAQALRVLASEFRDERLLRAEEKAARLPAVLTVPMIIFILPCLFIVLLGPAAMRTMDALQGILS